MTVGWECCSVSLQSGLCHGVECSLLWKIFYVIQFSLIFPGEGGAGRKNWAISEGRRPRGLGRGPALLRSEQRPLGPGGAVVRCVVCVCVWPCRVSLLLCLPFHLCLSLCPQGGLPQWQWLSVTGYLLPLLLPMHLGRLQGGRVPQPPTPGTPALDYAAQPGLPGPCRAPEQWSCFSLGGRHPGQDLPQLPASIQALPPPETLRSPWSSEPLFRACLPPRPFSRLLF